MAGLSPLRRGPLLILSLAIAASGSVCADELEDLAVRACRPAIKRPEQNAAIRRIAAEGGDRAGELLLLIWRNVTWKREVSAAITKLEGPAAVRAQRRVLVESARGAAFRHSGYWGIGAATALAEAGDLCGAHLLISQSEIGYCGQEEKAALARATGGAVDLTGVRWTCIRSSPGIDILTDESKAAAEACAAAERWWAARKGLLLRPIAGEVAQLRSQAAKPARDNPWPRRQAVVGLYVLGAETSEKWLHELLAEGDGYLQAAAARWLVRRGSMGFYREALREAAAADDPAVRAKAVTIVYAVLAQTGFKDIRSRNMLPEAPSALMSALEDEDPMVRRLAAFALTPRSFTTERSGNRSRGFHVDWLAPKSLDRYRAMLRDMETGGTSATEAFASGPNEWQRDFALKQLRYVRHCADTKVLVRIGRELTGVSAAPEEERAAFLRRVMASPLRSRLMDVSSERLAEVFTDYVIDHHPNGPCMNLDWHLSTERMLAKLIWSLEQYGSASGVAMGRVAGAEEATRLLEIMKGSRADPGRALCAGLALAMIGEKRAAPYLRQLVSEPLVHDGTRQWAAVALGGLGDWEKLPEMRRALARKLPPGWKQSPGARRAGKAPPKDPPGGPAPGKDFKGAHLAVRVPPGPRPVRPPSLQLPYVYEDEDLTDDELKVRLTDWWAERRAYMEAEAF